VKTRLQIELKPVIEDLFSVERASRELATKIQLGEAVGYEVEHELNNLEGTIASILDTIHDINRRIEEAGIYPDNVGKLDTVEEALDKARDAVQALITNVGPKIFGDQKNVNVPVDWHVVDEKLDELEKYVVELTGKRCRYRISNKLSSYLNDLASCIHRIAEHMSTIKLGREGRCNIVKDGKGKKFCLTWSKAVEENDRDGLYQIDDSEALEGWVVGDKVYLRVGSAEGHRTLVNLENGTLEYWDLDQHVNKLMEEILEQYAGLDCKAHDYGVSCTGITDENMDKVALALSMATSMDLRIDYPAKYWDDKYRMTSEKVLAIKWLKTLEKQV